MTTPALLAATIVLLRDSHKHAPEIFMVRRKASASFMGGAYVFPGGRLDAEDSAEALLARCRNVQDVSLQHLAIAAVRETFEEANLLFVCEEDGSGLVVSPFQKEEIARQRQALLQGKTTFYSALCKTLLYVDLSGLVPISRWITPALEPKRFDTYFFLAEAPKEQEATSDLQETSEGVWATAAEFVERFAAGEIFLAPPTLRTLENLLPFATCHAAIAAYKHKPIPTVAPMLKFDEGSESIFLLLPGDPEYTDPSEGPRIEGDTRIVVAGGRWWKRSE